MIINNKETLSIFFKVVSWTANYLQDYTLELIIRRLQGANNVAELLTI